LSPIRRRRARAAAVAPVRGRSVACHRRARDLRGWRGDPLAQACPARGPAIQASYRWRYRLALFPIARPAVAPAAHGPGDHLPRWRRLAGSEAASVLVGCAAGPGDAQAAAGGAAGGGPPLLGVLRSSAVGTAAELCRRHGRAAGDLPVAASELVERVL